MREALSVVHHYDQSCGRCHCSPCAPARRSRVRPGLGDRTMADGIPRGSIGRLQV